jgi:hypothetical protein
MMRLLRLTHEWNWRDIFRQRKNLTAHSTNVLTAVEIEMTAARFFRESGTPEKHHIRQKKI